MNLQEQINEDLKNALRAKDQVALATLRMLTSAAKNKRIELGKDLVNSDMEQIVVKEIKQRKDSIEQFAKGGRTDLADKEQTEIKILEKYLPEQLSEKELSDIIQAAISEVGASSASDIGKVMANIMPKIKGKADGGLVNKLVRENLEK